MKKEWIYNIDERILLNSEIIHDLFPSLNYNEEDMKKYLRRYMQVYDNYINEITEVNYILIAESPPFPKGDSDTTIRPYTRSNPGDYILDPEALNQYSSYNKIFEAFFNQRPKNKKEKKEFLNALAKKGFISMDLLPIPLPYNSRIRNYEGYTRQVVINCELFLKRLMNLNISSKTQIAFSQLSIMKAFFEILRDKEIIKWFNGAIKIDKNECLIMVKGNEVIKIPLVSEHKYKLLAKSDFRHRLNKYFIQGYDGNPNTELLRMAFNIK